MSRDIWYKAITYFTVIVWIAGGLVGKVLNLVPRHEAIVARIIGAEHARLFTLVFGLLEIALATWILTGRATRTNTIVQIVIVAVMNALEFALASDLLLWGRANAVFALMFIIMLYYKEFVLRGRNLERPR